MLMPTPQGMALVMAPPGAMVAPPQLSSAAGGGNKKGGKQQQQQQQAAVAAMPQFMWAPQPVALAAHAGSAAAKASASGGKQKLSSAAAAAPSAKKQKTADGAYGASTPSGGVGAVALPRVAGAPGGVKGASALPKGASLSSMWAAQQQQRSSSGGGGASSLQGAMPLAPTPLPDKVVDPIQSLYTDKFAGDRPLRKPITKELLEVRWRCACGGGPGRVAGMGGAPQGDP